MLVKVVCEMSSLVLVRQSTQKWPHVQDITKAMIRENWQLVTNELVEFEK